MTAHQQSKLNELRNEFRAVKARPDGHSPSVYVDAYDIAEPDLCLACGRVSEAHIGPWVDHSFRVSVPVATFRINASGWCQNLTPLEASA